MTFDSVKEFTYLKGYATGARMPNTIQALNYARAMHSTQTRKDGSPYIIHPLTMACHAVAMGINDDVIIAALLLHDVVEDCGVSLEQLPVDDNVKLVVNLVTKTSGYDNDKYYASISTDVRAIIVKLIDRCHNVSSMAGVFNEKKIGEYVQETKDYVMPLIRAAKDAHPEYSHILFILKYHIESIIDVMEKAVIK